MASRYASRLPAEAVKHSDGKRHCASCGDFIDPIDWCLDCTPEGACSKHPRLRKRADAAFCDAACRSAYSTGSGPVGRRRQSVWR